MKPVFIATAAAFGIAAATAFAMSTAAWAGGPVLMSDDQMDRIVAGRSQYAPPDQILNYVKENHSNRDSDFVTEWRSLLQEFYDERSLPGNGGSGVGCGPQGVSACR